MTKQGKELMSEKRAIPEPSIDTQTLERVLLTVEMGDVVSYKKLSEAIGRNVQNGAWHLLQSARHRVQREYDILFEPVRGEGLKRLDDAAIVGTVTATFNRVKNIARRGRQKIACVQDFDALPNDVKVKHNVAASIFGVLGQLTKESSVKKLEGQITNGKHDALPVAKFLDAMKQSL